MQQTQDVTPELFKPYMGGEVTVTSANGRPNISRTRGELLDVTILDGWVSLKLKGEAFARPAPEGAPDEDLVWKERDGGDTSVLLYGKVVIAVESGTLHFNEETPQGATATLKLADTSSNQQAA